MTEGERESVIAFICMAVAAIFLVIVAALVLLGCEGRIEGMVKPETSQELPLAFESAVLLGRWESGNGWRLDCNGSINGYAPADFWTLWPAAFWAAPSQRYCATVVYDLTLSPDTSGVGTIHFIGTRDSAPRPRRRGFLGAEPESFPWRFHPADRPADPAA